MSEKSLLRQQLRARHPGREVRDRESVLMCGHILASDLYRNARIIGGYMPLAREADVTPVLTDVLHTGRTLALPQRVVGVIKCKNPRCITSVEREIVHEFKLTDPVKKVYRCIYCEQKA